MSPQMIPLLLLCALCLLPICVGVGAFYLMSFFMNRLPTKDTHEFKDEAGRKHTVTDWSMLSRQERKFHKEPEVKE